METLKFKGWTIKVSDDVDGHLTLTVDHDDDSMVKDTGMDCAVNEDQFGVRLTTDSNEMKEHIRNLQIELGIEDESMTESDNYNVLFDHHHALTEIKKNRINLVKS